MDLKQSTAAVVSFGPFLDKTDGVTLEIGLVAALDHVSTGIMLSKNGGTLAVRHAAVTASEYDAHGCYKVTLDTTDTNTLGQLRMIYTDAATCLPVWQDLNVISANEFDHKYGSTVQPVNVTQISGVAQSATDLKDFADTGYDPAAHKVQGVVLADTATNLTNAPSNGDLTATMKASVTTAVPTTAQIKTAIEAAGSHLTLIMAKTDNLPASPADTSDIPSAATITDAVWDEAIAGHAGAGSTGAALAGASAPSAASVADAVWDELVADHAGVGSTGAALAAAGSAGDPWSTALPGAYGAGTAGQIIGDAILGAVAGTKVINAAGTEVLVYDKADNLLATLTRTGTGPYTWTAVWA